MSLAGRGVLVTRPRELARSLAQRIEQAGGEAILFPALEIVALPTPDALCRLTDFDLAVFISPTAVDVALRRVPRWPESVRAAAVGPGSREALEARGVRNVLAPACGADSEALLAVPELASLPGRRVLVIRGEEGRTALGETLRDRGAAIEYADCYRRARPATDAAPLLARWAAGEVHAVTALSAGTVRNLFELLGDTGAGRLRDTPLFVPHERIAAEAVRLGVREALVGEGEAGIVERLVAYFGKMSAT
jgi:uroporphyrinogen-III synthase